MGDTTYAQAPPFPDVVMIMSSSQGSHVEQEVDYADRHANEPDMRQARDSLLAQIGEEYLGSISVATAATALGRAHVYEAYEYGGNLSRHSLCKLGRWVLDQKELRPKDTR